MGSFDEQWEPLGGCERQKEAASGFEGQWEAVSGCKRQLEAVGWCEWDWEAVGGRWMSDAMGGNGWM